MAEPERLFTAQGRPYSFDLAHSLRIVFRSGFNICLIINSHSYHYIFLVFFMCDVGIISRMACHIIDRTSLKQDLRKHRGIHTVLPWQEINVLVLFLGLTCVLTTVACWYVNQLYHRKFLPWKQVYSKYNHKMKLYWNTAVYLIDVLSYVEWRIWVKIQRAEVIN